MELRSTAADFTITDGSAGHLCLTAPEPSWMHSSRNFTLYWNESLPPRLQGRKPFPCSFAFFLPLLFEHSRGVSIYQRHSAASSLSPIRLSTRRSSIRRLPAAASSRSRASSACPFFCSRRHLSNRQKERLAPSSAAHCRQNSSLSVPHPLLPCPAFCWTLPAAGPALVSATVSRKRAGKRRPLHGNTCVRQCKTYIKSTRYRIQPNAPSGGPLKMSPLSQHSSSATLFRPQDSSFISLLPS